MFQWPPRRSGPVTSDGVDDHQVRIRCFVCQTLIGKRKISRRALQVTRLRAYCRKHIPNALMRDATSSITYSDNLSRAT